MHFSTKQRRSCSSVGPLDRSCWTTLATGCDQHEKDRAGLFQATSSCSWRRKTYSKDVHGQVRGRIQNWTLSHDWCQKSAGESFFLSKQQTKAQLLLLFCRGLLSKARLLRLLLIQHPHRGQGLLSSGMIIQKTLWKVLQHLVYTLHTRCHPRSSAENQTTPKCADVKTGLRSTILIEAPVVSTQQCLHTAKRPVPT